MISLETQLELDAYMEKHFGGIDAKRAKICMSMRENLAQRNANNVWGNGFKFNSEDEKLIKAFKRIDKNNKLKSLFQFCEWMKSIYGRAIITLNKDKGGEVRFNITNPYFFNQVGKIFVTETVAVIYQRYIVDSKHFYLKTTYDTKKVVNEWYEQTGEKEVLIYDVESTIPKQFQVEKVWEHNLGFLPLVEFFNYPFRNVNYNMYQFDFLADWANSEFLEPIFSDVLLNFQKEINYCHSRIVLENVSQQTIDNLKKHTVSKDVNLGDFLIDGETGSRATAIPGNADFTTYTNALNDIMDLYYKFANSSRFSEGGGAQKTSAEVNQTRSVSTETIRQKITHAERDCTELIAKALAIMGEIDYFEDYSFQFEINGNIQRDDTVYLDNVIKQVNLGTMSMQEAIANLRNVDMQVAKSIFESIQDFNEEHEIVTQNSMSGMELEGDYQGSSPDGGRPEKEGVTSNE